MADEGYYDALPPSWPASVSMREDLVEGSNDGLMGGPTPRNGSASVKSIEKMMTEKANNKLSKRKNERGSRELHLRPLKMFAGCQLPVIDPNSRKMVMHDCFAILILMYELLLTPYVVAWSVESKGAFKAFSYITCLYWVLDAHLAFMVGYLDKSGLAVKQQPFVAMHYLTGWFMVDIALICIDVVVLVLLSLESTPFHVIRMVKIARMFTLLRLGRLVRILDKANTSLTVKQLMAFTLTKVFGGTLLMNHFLSCFWFFIGHEARSDTGTHWLVQLDNNEDFWWGYTTSFHWTLSQLTLGSHELNPMNSLERAYTIVLMVCGLLYGSTIISLFSAQVMQMVVLRQDQSALKINLRTYLRQNLVSNHLSAQVIRQASNRCKEQKMLHEMDVRALEYLTASLRNDLRKEIRMPDLRSHPLFEAWSQISEEGISMLCCQVITTQVLVNADDLFMPLIPASCAYCLSKGNLAYEPMPGGFFREGSLVEEKSWLCETALWCDWIHVGTAKAVGDCNLLCIDAENLSGLLKQFRLLLPMTLEYGRSYHARVVAASPPFAPHFPDDVEVPHCRPGELISMEVGMGLLLVALAEGNVSLTGGQQRHLEKELREGKCALEKMADGSLQRLVSLVVISLQYQGMVFMELGTMQDNNFKAQCQLPGAKQGKGELTAAAFQRVFDQSLWMFRGDNVTLSHTEQSVERMESQSVGIPSVYIRTQFQMEFVGDCDPLQHAMLIKSGGPKVVVLGTEETLSFMVAWRYQKMHIFAWVPEELVSDVKSPENVELLQVWGRGLSTRCLKQTAAL